MKEFKDKVAVITGAASGIGQGIAYRCGKEGMKVVISDINDTGLRRTEKILKQEGAQVLSVITDVSKFNEVEKLAEKTLEQFGKVHLLFNNAGIAIPRLSWEYELKDWEKVLGINLWGVIYGIKTFVPIMLEQDNECHIVNTSSIEGLISQGIGGATYGVCKHALVHLSERMTLELEELGSKIGISVLCPGFVATSIFASAIKSLSEYTDIVGGIADFVNENRREFFNQFVKESPVMTSEKVADIVFQGIRNKDLYIFTHKEPIVKELVKERLDAILHAFDK
ncbi:MAG: SDR family NAD(P)-dependent oxidoreductase [Promethearchaeota archaeon]|jgi:NAD(P)-dependent dehydrogenase (short-subunit alcohol dehydrogenase family)